jgi:hypothetical protein
MPSADCTATPARPRKRLTDGTPYFGKIGEMAYDEDRVQCHLCGRWFKVVGAIHIRAAHGVTIEEYREMFHLLGSVTTAAPQTSARKRRTMLDQIASGERVQPYDLAAGDQNKPQPGGRVQRWRSLEALRPDLVAQLHPTRNGSLDPGTIAPHSHRELWWRCSDCGHEWRTPPHERAGGRGCPECGKRRRVAATIARNKRPVALERSLAALHPDLLGEWHPTRNPGLDPRTIAPGSEKKAWWRCGECGHEWATAVNDRTRKRPGQQHPSGCPVCALARRARLLATAERDRSLAALYPVLLAEWHPTRNGVLDPFTVNPGSERKVWWRCAECGQEWSAAVIVRSRSPRGGCGRCARSRGQRERHARQRHAVASDTGQ